ncbi:MAG: hypothetical protein HC918_01605 [Oscillatoriales cyanobacterium SM2_1_8]|nr:hypothetical protein [Oscillatoriales cyanobacterium SM2_1_8]
MGVWRGDTLPDTLQTYAVTLRPTAWEIPAGAQLVLAIASAAFPAIAPNPHGEVAVHQARVSDGLEATHTVHSGQLRLPQVAQTEDRP